MKERILFECVGQAGGNIGQLFAKKGYICHFTNTSDYDLQPIDVDDTAKFHIPSAKGCNKDRKKAMRYAKNYYNHIVDVIDNGFPRQDIVFFVFSLGGGTGSGISPILLDYISQKNPKKNYGAIVILPSDDETIMAQRNAIEGYKQLASIKGLKSLFVIDNNVRNNNTQTNKEFVKLFDDMLHVCKSDNRGVIDEAELETMLTCKGMTVMGYVDAPNIRNKNIFITNVLAQYSANKSCQYFGISIGDSFNDNILRKTFGTPIDTFKGYRSDDNTFVIVTGLPTYISRIEELAKQVNDKQFDRINPPMDDVMDIVVPELEEFPPKKQDKETSACKVSFDDIFGKFME